MELNMKKKFIFLGLLLSIQVPILSTNKSSKEKGQQ